MKFIKYILILALLSGSAYPVFAQHGSGKKEALIPVDSALRTGVLPNGFRYYIRKNQEPAKRAELRLVIRAGSVLEDPDQLGMAHFVEHMSFNGTKHFQKNELVNFLERSGVKFGADLNASTSFDETTYQISIPSDTSRADKGKETILQKGFQVLEDWAHLVSFDHTEIDKERGVITEEWRLGRGANARMRDKYFPVILKGSRYAERIPIGSKESINKTPYAAIERFYKDWYRPDLEGVIAVGDFDVDAVEALIKLHFSGLKNPVNERKRPVYTIPDTKETIVSTVTDKEQSYNIVELIYKQKKASDKTLSDLRAELARELFNQMLNSRISELVQASPPPFIQGASYYGRFLADKDAFQCFAVANNAGSIKTALATLVNENERVHRFGFSESEFKRAKANLLNQDEKAFRERNKTNSKVFTQEYIENFTRGTAMPGIAFEYMFSKNNMDAIPLKEVNSLAERFTMADNRLAVVMAPEKFKASLPNPADLIAILNHKGMADLTAYQDDMSDKPLLSPIPPESPISEEHKNAELGMTELMLNNGLRVLLKPTDFKNDEILISGFSKGGTSLYSDKDFLSASFSTDIVNESGLGNFNSIQLSKALAGKTVNVSPFIDDYQEGISGSSNPKDLETALQMIHLYFEKPRNDSISFHSFISRQTDFLENRNLDPGFVFSDSVNAIMSSYNKRKLFPDPKEIRSIRLDTALKIYAERFADASGFTFVVVGNFDVEKIKPMLSRYLGSLPSSHTRESWKDDLKDYPKGAFEKIIKKGAEQKSQVRLFFTGNATYTPDINDQLAIVLSTLEIRLRENLREDKGGTYGVSVSGSVSKFPRQRYRISISFGCAPENRQKLITAALDEVRTLKLNGSKATDLAKVKTEQNRAYEVNMRQNHFWLMELTEHAFFEENPSDILSENKKIQAITIEESKKIANAFFNFDNLATISLTPGH